MKKARVLIADDHEEMRGYIVVLLSTDYEVVGVVTNGEELVQAAICLHPDIIVSDISMPRMDGFAARIKLIDQGKPFPFVFVSVRGKEIIHMLPKASSVGLVYKSEMARHLFHALDAVLKGQIYLSPFYHE